MKYILIHGSFLTPNTGGYPWLKENLEDSKQEILVPEFPVNTWDEITNGGENYPAKARFKFLARYF